MASPSFAAIYVFDFLKDVDAGGVSASTRVFDPLCAGMTVLAGCYDRGNTRRERRTIATISSRLQAIAPSAIARCRSYAVRS
jgi:hypothetical protein